jgi:hypothetical protein
MTQNIKRNVTYQKKVGLVLTHILLNLSIVLFSVISWLVSRYDSRLRVLCFSDAKGFFMFLNKKIIKTYKLFYVR